MVFQKNLLLVFVFLATLGSAVAQSSNNTATESGGCKVFQNPCACGEPSSSLSKTGPCTEPYAVCVNRPSAICGRTGSAANPNNLICGWTITGSSLECFKNFTETPVNGSTFPILASPAGTATSTPSKSASARKAGSLSLFFSNSVTVALLLVVMTTVGGLVL
ncbi:hypothetical protein BJ742DRAFT_774626 [Cladochytrium replicatum]|nr:hypothetical protein BJ742DRAFT_774626 [Cladochytrium replicatum]